MVLPYEKSPAAMVNARVIGGRYGGIITGSQKVMMNYSKFGAAAAILRKACPVLFFAGPTTGNKRRSLTLTLRGRRERRGPGLEL